MIQKLEKSRCRKDLVKRSTRNLSRIRCWQDGDDNIIKCFDDITGKEPRWQAVKQAWEQELKYPREIGVYEKAENTQLWPSTTSPPSTQKWIDTDTAFEEEPMQIRSRNVARDFKREDRPLLEPLRDIISIAANHNPEFSLMHVDVSRTYFHGKAQRVVPVKLPAEDCSGKHVGKKDC